MLTIGFANKFYTLWDVMEVEVATEYSKWTERRNAYIQNISMSLDEAKKKYPNAPVDESLRGHSSSFVVKGEKCDIHTDLFNFGKYMGSSIAECTDENYLVWFYDNCCGERRNCVASRLVEGFGYHLDGERIYSSTERNNRVAMKNAEIAFENALANHEAISFVPESNLKNSYVKDEVVDTCGFCNGNGDYAFYWLKPNVQIVFTEFTVNSYNGYDYALPAINGKGKRIKNKNVVITDYEFIKYADENRDDSSVSLYENGIRIVVKKFHIEK